MTSHHIITDTDMHATLTAFVQTRKENLCELVQPIQFVNEGVFTSVTRMQTKMRLELPPAEYPSAVEVELRGAWHYPKMTTKDFMPLEPDAAVIILRDARGGALARFRPGTLEEVEDLLSAKVFGMDTLAARLQAFRMAKEREVLLKRKIAEFELRVRTSVPALVDRCDDQIRALARAISLHIQGLEIELMQEDPTAAASALCMSLPAVKAQLQRRLYEALWDECGSAAV